MLAKATKIVVGAVALLLVAAPAWTNGIDWDTVSLVKHSEYQAVDADGKSAYGGGYPVKMRGVILNNHEEMLDPAYNAPEWMGGQWQIFIQSSDVRDHAGTACWMGQKYGNIKGDTLFNYTEANWLAEMYRLNYDPGNPSHQFRAGDLVEIRVRAGLYYNGKRNVNEAHDNDYDRYDNWDGQGGAGDGQNHDFEIVLLEAGYGMPASDLMTLAQVMNPDDGDGNTHEDIFDHTRREGGEYFQGRLVRINDLTIVDDSGWGKEKWSERICTVTDGEGRIFKLRMPRGSVVDLGPAPIGEFDVVGIFNQEGGNTYGYEVYVTDVVPEPAGVSMLVLGTLAMLRRRRSR